VAVDGFGEVLEEIATSVIRVRGSGVPSNFVQGGVSTNSVEDTGHRERGSGDGSSPSQGFWRQL